MKRFYCTYFDRNYLFKALTLISSLQKHEDEFTIFAVCLDEIAWNAIEKLHLTNVIAVPLRQIEKGDDKLLSAKANRSKVEYYFTLTPVIILWLMEHYPEVDIMTYVDADLFFFASPDPIFYELDNQSVLIHEHRFSAIEAYKEKLWGKYNVGMLCFRNNENGLTVVRWWRERCLEWCYNRAEDGKYADQGYLNEFPERFKEVVVLKHKGAGVALWNHDQYRYHTDGNGNIMVDNLPLLFFHFSALQMVYPDFILPDKFGSYPKFSLNEIKWILIPYVQAMFESIDSMHSVLPDFSFGLADDVHVTNVHDFLSRGRAASKIETMNLPHKRSYALDGWYWYACTTPCTKQTDRPIKKVQKSSNNEHGISQRGFREKIYNSIYDLIHLEQTEVACWVLSKLIRE